MTERYSIVRSPAYVAALEAGETKFTADAPCFRGHAPIRYTNTGVCVECLRLRQKTKVPSLGRAAPPVAPGIVTLQVDMLAQDVRYLQVCAALLVHPTQARLLRAFLERNQQEVRGDLPGAILKRV